MSGVVCLTFWPRHMEAIMVKSINCNIHGNNVRAYKHGRRLICGYCQDERVSKWRHNKRNELIKRAGGQCTICGYNKYTGALEFHHIDPSTKEMNLSVTDMYRKDVYDEINKCILVCANCHRELQVGMVEW